MWAIVIFLAACVLALFASGVWLVAIPLSLMAVAIALTLRLSGRISESGMARTPENQP